MKNYEMTAPRRRKKPEAEPEPEAKPEPTLNELYDAVLAELMKRHTTNERDEAVRFLQKSRDLSRKTA